mgnify:CR=1 FL=1
MSESGQVTANEEEVPPTEEATVTRRWMVIKDPSILPLKDAIVINNLEFVGYPFSISLKYTSFLTDFKLSKQASKLMR